MSRGAERRRFMDLGILPGTVITAEMISPSGDPTAYRVRGAVIGLRREQANLIQITRNVEPEPPVRKTFAETQPVEVTA
ncbi:MAG: ferrous iron transport protein A [Anaerolineae bacterium]|nr:ferrous iron transport protein A [Anaerolineae bacterium]